MAAPIENTFVREVETNTGQFLKIHQLEVGDVGCVVWDAALVLSKYIETPDFKNGELLQGKKILELGAGTGCVGIMAAHVGGDAIITDLPDFVPLIQMNIGENRALLKGSARAQPLTWGQDTVADYYHYIFLADCIYYDESIDPLVKTLVDHCGEDTKVFCCYEERITGNKPQLQRKFFQLISEHFDTEEIPLEHQDSHFRSEDIHIFRFVRKKA
ncbi:protein N-lysine methyltransferase METTL21D-like isoform X2 [Ostrea edulis]|uniref:protein N-lysine methyltransferase METTL21D-like isoform X2 n=1 Tax=Ostrea edulis TaxID=37623 RepID=UPI0024AF3949|nr:protein N-lysine methyltransferase METTL21D-like isoform X2 [Ostrea edulis]XP_048747038.2 protein N-lysine methyltransferase METTL21D-like isoform X2 [Ostrea edulis]